MTDNNAWLSALAAEHMAALKAQDAHYRVQAMNGDEGEDT